MTKKIKTEIDITSTDATIKTEKNDVSETVRPLYLKDFIGQTELKNSLQIYINASKQRSENLDHVLMYGSAGLGKTTLSKIIANEMNAHFVVTSAPAIEKAGDLISILIKLQENDVLFIDEIHRLPKHIEEVLYSAMEDYYIDIVIGKEEQTKSMRITLPHFTLIGATTRAGMLSEPLRNRFGIVFKLDYYNKEELKQIVLRSAGILNCLISEQSANLIAVASKGTPREANRLLKRIRDYAQIQNNGVVSTTLTMNALKQLGIDNNGLNENDRRLLQIIHQNFNNGPVGLETLSISLGEDAETVELVYEPYLIRNGYLLKTPKGRSLTDKSQSLMKG